MNGTIYLLTFPNGKGYVGQTIQPMRKRLRQHRSKKAYAVGAAWAKYGKPEVVVLAEGLETQAELDRAEELLIAGMGTMAPRGYNLETGGRGRGTVSEITRARHAESKIGNTNGRGNKGRKASPEQRPNYVAAARKRADSYTPEQKAATAAKKRAIAAARTLEQREAIAAKKRAKWAAQTPEQRADIQARRIATRAANKAKRNNQ